MNHLDKIGHDPKKGIDYLTENAGAAYGPTLSHAVLASHCPVKNAGMLLLDANCSTTPQYQDDIVVQYRRDPLRGAGIYFRWKRCAKPEPKQKPLWKRWIGKLKRAKTND